MNIPLQNLLDFVSQAVDAGIQGYIKSVEPKKDRIKQSEAMRYLAQRGYQSTMLKRWTDAKLLTPIKDGDKRNSAVWYSLAEIKRVMTSITLKRINNEEVLA